MDSDTNTRLQSDDQRGCENVSTMGKVMGRHRVRSLVRQARWKVKYLLWYRTGIHRGLTKLIHKFNFHHTTKIGPMNDGVVIHKCEWCGVSRVDTPYEVTLKRMKESLEKLENVSTKTQT